MSKFVFHILASATWIIFMRYGASGQNIFPIRKQPKHNATLQVGKENLNDRFFIHKYRVQNYTKFIHDDVAKFLISSFMTFCPNVPLCYDGGEFYRNYSFPFGRNVGVCQRCSCNPNCEKKADCCISRYLSHDLDQKQDVSKPTKYSCLSTQLGRVTNGRGYHVNIPRQEYWMVANCPDGYPRNTLWRKCKRFLPAEERKQEELFTPVISASSNETYQNKYCAECFGELQIELFPWGKKVTRNMNDKTTTENDPFLAAYEKRVIIAYVPPLFLYETFTCQKPTASKCNITCLWKIYDERLLWACETLPQTVVYNVEGGHVYKNIYCVLCNAVDPDLTLRVAGYAFDRMHIFEKISLYPSMAFGISSLTMSFEALEILSDYTIDKKCRAEEVYSPILKRCLPIHCDTQYVQRGPKCQRTATHDISVVFFVSFAICNVEVFSYEMRVELRNRMFHTTKQFKQIIVKFALAFLTQSDIICISIVSTFHLARDENIMAVSYYLTTFLSDLIRSGTNDSKHQIRINDFNKLSRQFYNDTFRSDPDTAFAMIYSYSMVTPWQHCPKVSLPNSYHLNYSDFEICILEYNVCFESYLAEINEQNDVAICLDLYMEIVNNKTRMLIATYLQETDFLVISSSVSSLGCLFAFVVSVKTHETANLQKRITQALFLSLFMANTFNTVSRFLVNHFPLCMLFGILSHCLWLMVVCWMCISCLELFFTTSTVLKASSRSKHTLKCMAYLTISLALCAVVVTIHLQISYHVSDGSSVGYSKTTCFVADGLLKTFTLLLPVVLVVFINSFLYVVVTCCIKRHRVISNPQHHKLLKAYFKLSIIAGIAWVSYFLHELIDTAFFLHTQMFLNSCLGVFIFVSFGIRNISNK